jgi:hypothetical protein
MQDPIGTLDIISTNHVFTDPAIDTTETEVEETDEVSRDGGDEPAEGAPRVLSAEAMLREYRRTRDITVLRMRPGVQPNKFSIQRLNAAYILAVLKALPESQRIVMAVSAACHLVTTADGKSLRPKVIKPANYYGVKLADEREWIHTLAKRFPMETIEEIGRAALSLASLPEGAAGPFA